MMVGGAKTRNPRKELRGLRLRVGNSQPRQQSSQQGASTPGPPSALRQPPTILPNPGFFTAYRAKRDQPWTRMDAKVGPPQLGRGRTGLVEGTIPDSKLVQSPNIRVYSRPFAVKNPGSARSHPQRSGTNPGDAGALLAGLCLCRESPTRSRNPRGSFRGRPPIRRGFSSGGRSSA